MSLPSPIETTEQEVDVILHVDPNALVIGTNVRRDAVADRQLVESVRALGVLDAVSAYRDQDGSLVVLRGQRRTLAGREAQAATIPVRVVPAPEEADRIAGQLVENERREQMTRADVVQAFSELADLGHSRTWIAKRTGTKAAEVKAALTVAGSASARTALHESAALTLDQAAALAEVEDDHADYEELYRAATQRPGSYAHVLQQIRDRRAAAVALTERAAELTAAGWAVVREDTEDEQPADGRAWTTVRGCTIRDEETGRTTPAPVADLSPADDLRITLETRDQYDHETGRWVRSVREDVEVTIEGAKARGWHTTARGQIALTPEQAAEKREAELTEKRRIRAGNAEWRAACKVRGEWITTRLAGRKTPPTGAEALVAWAVLTRPYSLERAYTGGHRATREALGIKGETWQTQGVLVERAEQGTPRAAIALAALAVVMAWQDRSAENKTWDSPTADDRRILTHLAAAGYELADIEAAMLPQPKRKTRAKPKTEAKPEVDEGQEQTES